MPGLIRREVHDRPTVDDLLRQAADLYIAERPDMVTFNLDNHFARLAHEASAEARFRQMCHDRVTTGPGRLPEFLNGGPPCPNPSAASAARTAYYRIVADGPRTDLVPKQEANMARGHRTPLYDKVVAVLENWIDLRTCHMADGVITEDEERIELAYITDVVLPIAVDNADASHLANAIHRYGPEIDSVERMITRRRHRRLRAPVPEVDEVICRA